MGFGIRAMVQELSRTLDAVQDKPEPIGHALELQESQKNTFPGYLLAERVFPAICLQRGISDSRPVQLKGLPGHLLAEILSRRQPRAETQARRAEHFKQSLVGIQNPAISKPGPLGSPSSPC